MILCVRCPFFFEKPIENSSLFQKETQLRQPIIRNYRVLMKHKGNGGMGSKAMAFSPLDVFLKAVLNSPREITSVSCGACSMTREQNMIWIITFWNKSTFLMIYWDAALEFILHWPYSDFRVDRFWRWDDTKNYLRNRQQTNKNCVTKPAQTGL